MFFIPWSVRVWLAFSNWSCPYSKMGSVIGFKVIASSRKLKMSSMKAGQPEKNLTYTRTCITFIKFHIDFKDRASITVTTSCTTTNVFAADSTDFLVVYMSSIVFSLGSILGNSWTIWVPGAIGSPFYSLAKNLPSTMVAISLSFFEPIETRSGFSNSILNCKRLFLRSAAVTTKAKFSGNAAFSAPL